MTKNTRKADASLFRVDHESGDSDSAPPKKTKRTVPSTSAMNKGGTRRSRPKAAQKIDNDRPNSRPQRSHSLGEARQDSPIITPFEEYLEEHSRELFDTFADKNTPSVIGPEGIENLCTSAGIPPDGAQLFILAWQLHCTELARITYDEWLMGMGKLRISSLHTLALALHHLEDLIVYNKQPINEPPTVAMPGSSHTSRHMPYDTSQYLVYAQDSMRAFSELYQFCFDVSREPDARNLSINRAITLWNMLLQLRYPIISEIIQFLEDRPSYQRINKDVWRMVLEFCKTIHPNLDNYEIDGEWPTMLDEFVIWKRGKISANDTGHRTVANNM